MEIINWGKATAIVCLVGVLVFVVTGVFVAAVVAMGIMACLIYWAVLS